MEEYTSTITRHFSTSVTSRFQSSLSIAGLMKLMSTPFFDMVKELGVERASEAGFVSQAQRRRLLLDSVRAPKFES